MHDLAETPRIAFGDPNGNRSRVALRTEFGPLLRKVARNGLIRTETCRQDDRIASRVLGHHTGLALPDGLHTDIA